MRLLLPLQRIAAGLRPIKVYVSDVSLRPLRATTFVCLISHLNSSFVSIWIYLNAFNELLPSLATSEDIRHFLLSIPARAEFLIDFWIGQPQLVKELIERVCFALHVFLPLPEPIVFEGRATTLDCDNRAQLILRLLAWYWVVTVLIKYAFSDITVVLYSILPHHW